MSSTLPRALLEIAYEEAAQAYLRSLPPEHFREATAQATQRKITLESLDLLRARRPQVQVFNELLVQYPLPRQRKPGQVVPDNMVVVCAEPVRAETSFNLLLEPAGPFWMLEYVSKNNKRKNYEDNFDKYERDLKVPYFLLFYPNAPARLELQDVFNAIRDILSKEALLAAGDISITKRRKRRKKAVKTDATAGQTVTEENEEDNLDEESESPTLSFPQSEAGDQETKPLADAEPS